MMIRVLSLLLCAVCAFATPIMSKSSHHSNDQASSESTPSLDLSQHQSFDDTNLVTYSLHKSYSGAAHMNRHRYKKSNKDSDSHDHQSTTYQNTKQHHSGKKARYTDRHKSEKAIAFGSIFATYLATVTIDDMPYICILDTGSSDFAVAASPECGCEIYYKGAGCQVEGQSDNPPIHLSVQYGDGNWTGVPCTDHVAMGDVDLGDVTFAGMYHQNNMLECDESHQQNGIIGLGFTGLLGPPTNYTIPLFDSIAVHAGLPRIFSLQCCGWQNDTLHEYNPEYAEGALDLGGPNTAHYKGPIFYSPIIERLFYAVDMIDVRIADVSVMPSYRRTAASLYRRPEDANADQGQLPDESHIAWSRRPFPPQTIVDSGTSNIVFTAELWNNTIEALKKLVPPQPDAVWRGEDCLAHNGGGRDITVDWPDLQITLAGDSDSAPFTLTIPPCNYLPKAPAKECSNGKPGHAFSIEMETDEGNILGQVVYEAFYVVHDLQQNRVGFAMLDGCQSSRRCLKQVDIKIDDQLVRADFMSHNHDIYVDKVHVDEASILLDQQLASHWLLIALTVCAFIVWLYIRRTGQSLTSSAARCVRWPTAKSDYESILDDDEYDEV